MKKLNNKGFAISTMLYGILTLIILVLTLLLTIMRSSYNKTTLEEENVSYYLDKCISKQVALEQCYQTYNSTGVDCSDEYESYTTCMGVSESSLSNTNISKLNQLLVDKDLNNTLIKDSAVTSGTRYIYIGSPNNYVKVGDVIGRVISIETDGTIKVVLTSESITLTGVEFDSTTSSTSGNALQRFSSSTLYNKWNSTYTNLNYTNKLTTGTFYGGVIYSSTTMSNALTIMESESNDNTFGIVSLYDLVKASNTSTCNSSKIGSSCSSWLTTEAGSICHWTSTAYGSLSNFVTYSSSGLSSKSVTSTCSSNIVVYLKANTTVINTVAGTETDPYVVQ